MSDPFEQIIKLARLMNAMPKPPKIEPFSLPASIVDAMPRATLHTPGLCSDMPAIFSGIAVQRVGSCYVSEGHPLFVDDKKAEILRKIKGEA